MVYLCGNYNNLKILTIFLSSHGNKKKKKKKRKKERKKERKEKMPVTNRMLNRKKEDGCIAITAERKYYHVGETFVKRSLRPHEWQVSLQGTIHVPRLGRERILNEAASLRFIREHTAIPVPTVHACFEDDEAVYLVTEYVQGEDMASLNEEQKGTVMKELERHLDTLRTLVSEKIGGPSGLVVPPYRVTKASLRDDWNLRSSEESEYVFCHNDLSQHNVIVDPQTLSIRAIVDWEYAGFYPTFFESRFFRRIGPSAAIGDEQDDSERLLEFLQSMRSVFFFFFFFFFFF